MRCAARVDRVAATQLAATRRRAQRQHQLGLSAKRASHAARRARAALLHPARDELRRAARCNNCVTCDTGFVATAARGSQMTGVLQTGANKTTIFDLNISLSSK